MHQVQPTAPSGINGESMGMRPGFPNEHFAGSVDISPTGRLFQLRRGMIAGGINEEELTKMKDFGKQVYDGLMDGSFDAASLAASAPEGIKSFAEKIGIDLESSLNDLSTRFQEHDMQPGFHANPSANEQGNWGPHLIRELFGGQMRPMEQLSELRKGMFEKGMNEEQLTKMRDFDQQIHTSLRDGSFDAAALAQSAPEELINQSEEMGIDLESALNDLFTRFNEHEMRFPGHNQAPPR